MQGIDDADAVSTYLMWTVGDYFSAQQLPLPYKSSHYRVGVDLALNAGMAGAFIVQNTRRPTRTAPLAGVLVAVLTLSAGAQTRIEPDKNSYSPEQDVQLGQQAAAEVRQQLPLVRDESTDQFVEGIGDRLVDAIPRDLRQPAFRYSFDVVNLREINAFASARRPDVPPPRDDRSRALGRRSGRCHGSRVESRDSAPRDRAGDEGPEISDWRHRWTGSSARSSVAAPAASSLRDHKSGWACTS